MYKQTHVYIWSC